MSTRVTIHHVTTYRYERAVVLSPQEIRLRPSAHCRTPILAYSLRVEPDDHTLHWQLDPLNNYVARVVFGSLVREFRVTVDLGVELVPINPFDFYLEPGSVEYPFSYSPSLARQLLPYLELEPETPRLAEFVASVRPTRARTVDFVVDLAKRLEKDIAYIRRMEPGVQTTEETLKLGRGSCRDTAWLLVQTLRRLGIAARFVSGYLVQLAADPAAADARDVAELHAWGEAYLPGAGWVGIDSTSGYLAAEGHIPLAGTPEPESATAISGSAEGCKTELLYEMSVSRVGSSDSESPSGKSTTRRG